MNPTEHEMTAAVDAAARHAWTILGPQLNNAATFDELHPLEQNQLREQVLGPVIAGLEALPDRAEEARLAAIREVHAEAIGRLLTATTAEVVQARLVHDRRCRDIITTETDDCTCDIAGTAKAVLHGLLAHVFADYRRCRICGCTNDLACWPTCYWVEVDLCSSCRNPAGQAD